MTDATLAIDGLDALIEEGRQLSENVPFGDSCAKKILFAHGQDGPAQEYRHHVLQLRIKLEQLKKTHFNRARLLLDIEGLTAQRSRARTSLDQRRLDIDLEEKRFDLVEQEKYIHDALLEVQAHRHRLSQLPAINSRADYEQTDATYYLRKLLTDLQDQYTATGRYDVGTLQAVRQLGLIASREPDGSLRFAINPERLAELGLSVQDIPFLISGSEPDALT